MARDDQIGKKLRHLESQLRDTHQQLASCRQQEDALRRISRRLAVAAQGRDDELDRLLDHVNESVRRDATEQQLERLAQDLSKAVMVLEDFPAKARVLCARRLAAAVHWPNGFMTAATELALAKDADPIGELSDLINRALAYDGSSGKEGGIGQLFGRLLRRGHGADTPAAADEEAAERGDTDEAPPDRDDDCRVPVQEALQELVERLPLTAELDREVESIKDKLVTGDDADTRLAVRGLADLFTRIRADARREIAEYRGLLGDVSTKLGLLDKLLSQEFASQEQYQDNTRSMEALVDGQIGDMRNHIEAIDDPATLRAVLNERLETLSGHFHAFRQSEEQRLHEALERATEMRERVSELEQEAEQMRQSMEHERNRASTDSLTGLPNRLQIDERVAAEFERYKRYKQPLSIVVWDVDYFKRINDRFGHKAGDKVLRIVARKLAERARTTDFVGRYGGEEFLMLLIGTNGQDALQVADEIRQTIADCRFHHRESPVLVSISGGVAEFTDNDDPESVFERADAAMYRAKQAGRNCCILAASS